MTRINTNISSLNAQKSLAKSNVQLQQALTRLSTGLRINSGKDDPAGMIASEVLRSDIVSTQRAITNSERANQMIGTADSGLGQVTSLLNDIRGLITEAANSGAMSAEQIAANQLQVDSSLDALNRIAQVTSFQGRRLLDGSLDFITESVAGMSTVSDLQIDQATLPTSGPLGVTVDITSAAEKASLTDTGFTAGAKASTTLSFAPGDTIDNAATVGGAATGTVDIISTSLTSGKAVNIKLEEAAVGAGNVTAAYDGSTNLTLYFNTGGGKATTAKVVEAINNTTGVKEYFHAVVTLGDGTQNMSGADADGLTAVETFQVEANIQGGVWNHLAVSFKVADLGSATPTATYDPTDHAVTITIDDTQPVLLTAIETAVEAIKVGGVLAFTATIGGAGARTYVYGGGGADDEASGNTGTTGGNLLNDSLVLELSGVYGSQAFSFQAGASVSQMVDAINLQSDATGVTASFAVATGSPYGATLTLNSATYGSDAFVDSRVLSEGVNGTFGSLLSGTRDTGADIVATVNGMLAMGRGNTLSINTSTLALSATVADGSSTDFSFNITGGGALFQLGPDVVSNQQSRLGIQSVNTSRLGGVNGRLYQLGSGQVYDLNSDPNQAAKIVEEVLVKVSNLRGRLGAFQKTTVDTNVNTLTDTLENLTAAESSIRDADFAAESAALTRAQILVQSGTAVLAIANQGPQNVLALLR